jgi:hypothetical protein
METVGRKPAISRRTTVFIVTAGKWNREKCTKMEATCFSFAYKTMRSHNSTLSIITADKTSKCIFLFFILENILAGENSPESCVIKKNI